MKPYQLLKLTEEMQTLIIIFTGGLSIIHRSKVTNLLPRGINLYRIQYSQSSQEQARTVHSLLNISVASYGDFFTVISLAKQCHATQLEKME